MQQEIMDNTQIARIKVDFNYFKTCAKREYTQNLPVIWIREALQNSTDAGAENVWIELTDDEITFTDDGKGMDSNIINNKLLTLGGSQKDAGAVGGFGKAKEVLFFCHSEWSITSCPNKTTKYFINHQMIDKVPIRITKGEFNRGTIIKIKYDSAEFNKQTWASCIRGFVSTCSTKTKIFLNCDELQKLENRGKCIEYDIGTLRINKSKKTNNVYVRIRGITMFYFSSWGDIEALITLDLKGESIDLMSSSRERLLDIHQSSFNRIIKTILANPKSIVDKGHTLTVDKYSMREALEFKKEIQKTGSEEISDAVDDAIQALERGDKSALDYLLNKVEGLDENVAGRLRLIVGGFFISDMGYNFVVYRDGEKKATIDPTSPKAQTILHVWKRTVEQVMKDNQLTDNVIVGLTFSPSAEASHTATRNFYGETEHHILINPTVVEKYSDAVDLGFFLHDRACHELAHIRIEDHYENFCLLWLKYMNARSKDSKKYRNMFRKAKEEVNQIIKKNSKKQAN